MKNKEKELKKLFEVNFIDNKYDELYCPYCNKKHKIVIKNDESYEYAYCKGIKIAWRAIYEIEEIK